MWNPIDSAPCDGTEFLAYDPVAKKFAVCFARREPPYTNWDRKVRRGEWVDINPTQIDGEYGPDDDDFWGSRATYWAPLPLPPTAEQIEVAGERKMVWVPTSQP